jgi:hypothetical protein
VSGKIYTWSGTLRRGEQPNTVVGEIADSIGSYSIAITGTRTADGSYALVGVPEACPDWLSLPFEEEAKT